MSVECERREIDIKKLLQQSPFPVLLADECVKAKKILKQESKASKKYSDSDDGFIDKAQAKMGVIPTDLIQKARGIVIMVVSKSSFLLGGATFGAGVLMKRSGGGWSAPAAVGTAGFVFGPQFGIAKMNVIYLLQTDEAIEAFQQNNVKLSGALSAVAGPLGRNAEVGATGTQIAPIYVYCLSKGLHIGATLEGTFVIQRPEANEKFYGEKVTAEEVIDGKVGLGNIVPPDGLGAAQNLHEALSLRESGGEIS